VVLKAYIMEVAGMASEAQIEANRRNALFSTGPRTADGKSVSRGNALRHGLAAHQVVAFDERHADFAAFYDDMRVALAPADAFEEALVERIAIASWRLRRVWRAEAVAINNEAERRAFDAARGDLYRNAMAEYQADPPERWKDKPPEAVERALRAHFYNCSDEEIEATLAARATDDAEDAGAADADAGDDDGGDAPPRARLVIWPQRLGEFSRYEATLERSLQRAAATLERRQARRRGEPVIPPIAIEV
jgi:hypothetical protein